MSGFVQKIKEGAIDMLSGVEKPSCSLTHVGFKDVSRKDVTLQSTLGVSNPYADDLPIITINYKVFCNSEVRKDEIASGQLMNVENVKGNDTTNIDLPTKVEYDFLWSLLKDIQNDGDIDYRLEVGIQFVLPIVGKFTLPLHHEGVWKLSDIF